MASLRRRVEAAWVPLGGARWREDPAFAAAGHVRGYRVTDRRTFEAYASGWMATPLDLSRPPWDVHVVTGLPDGGFAILLKLHPLRQGRAACGRAATVLRAIRRPPAPALVTGSSAGRRLAFVRLDAADVRYIRRHHGGTTNDVALAVIAGGLRDWLLTRDLPVAGVTPRALVPVNTRARGHRDGGNQLSGYLCGLPVGCARPPPGWPRRCCSTRW